MTKLSALLAVALMTPVAIQEPARAPQDPPHIAGIYAVKGTTDDGPYQGFARIEQRGRIVFVVWQLGNRQLAGLGLITGASLAASYALENGMGAIAVYQIEATRLVGEWPDGDTIHEEILTKHTGPQAADAQLIPRGDHP